jgi:hypothetical protein
MSAQPEQAGARAIARDLRSRTIVVNAQCIDGGDRESTHCVFCATSSLMHRAADLLSAQGSGDQPSDEIVEVDYTDAQLAELRAAFMARRDAPRAALCLIRQLATGEPKPSVLANIRALAKDALATLDGSQPSLSMGSGTALREALAKAWEAGSRWRGSAGHAFGADCHGNDADAAMARDIAALAEQAPTTEPPDEHPLADPRVFIAAVNEALAGNAPAGTELRVTQIVRATTEPKTCATCRYETADENGRSERCGHPASPVFERRVGPTFGCLMHEAGERNTPR